MLYLCTAARKRPGGLLAGYGQQLLVTATATGGLTGMRKNNPLLPVFCTGTAARSRPNFDDVIRADQPPTSQNLRNTAVRGLSAENFITDNVKIQALNLVNFRLRFADKVKIQF